MTKVTYRDLRQLLFAMTEEQLDQSITVSEGCDDNGNAVFLPIADYSCVGSGVIDAAADGVLEDGQLVLLINEIK